jgi:cyclopropane-fatty-acyl-phospholipid synthase
MFLLDRLLTRLVRAGPLTIIDPKGRRRTYGTPCPATKPVTVRLADRRVAWGIALRPMLATGEAYMDGRLIVEEGDIRDLLHLAGYNARWEGDNPARSVLWRRRRRAPRRWTGRRRARRNGAHQ